MTTDDRRRGAELIGRFDAMGLTPDEVRTVINFLIGAAPDRVESALDHVERIRAQRPQEDDAAEPTLEDRIDAANRCICDPDDLFDPPDPRPRAVAGCPAHRARRAAQRFAEEQDRAGGTP